jgi:hypothetical protein
VFDTSQPDPSRDGRERVGGVSVFTIDPGTGTGWAWACVGWKELGRYGAEGALTRARSLSSSGRVASTGLGDVRFRMGEINSKRGDIETAQDVLIQAIVSSHMGNRVSKGRVPYLTHIVGESFSFRERTKSRHMLVPIRVLAAFEALMARENELRYTEFSHQSSAEMSVITDERQKRWDLWFPGKKDGNVAIKHLIVKLRSLA